MYRKPELKAVDGVLSQAVHSAGSIGLVPLPAAGTGPAAQVETIIMLNRYSLGHL